MRIDNFREFVAVTEEGSINKASQKLYVSQQHLSRIINSLEEKLGTQLLKRNISGVTLTAHGEKFLEFAKRILAEYDQMNTYFREEKLRDMRENSEIQGECCISVPYFFSLFLADLMEKCKEYYPNIKLQCVENDSDVLDNTAGKEKDSTIYIALDDGGETVSRLLKDSSYCKNEVGRTGVAVCVNKNSDLAENAFITKKEFASHKGTAFPKSLEFNKMCNNEVLFISTNIAQHLDSVQRNHSICIMPSYVNTIIAQRYPDVLLLPFEWDYWMKMYILYDETIHRTAAEMEIVKFLEVYLSDVLNK